MKKITVSLALLALGLVLATTALAGSDAKTYQVTGPVLEITPTTITVQKGEDKWQLACDKATAGKVKVGDKVTVYYQMVATEVEAKPSKKKQ